MKSGIRAGAGVYAHKIFKATGANESHTNRAGNINLMIRIAVFT